MAGADDPIQPKLAHIALGFGLVAIICAIIITRQLSIPPAPGHGPAGGFGPTDSGQLLMSYMAKFFDAVTGVIAPCIGTYAVFSKRTRRWQKFQGCFAIALGLVALAMPLAFYYFHIFL